MINGDEIHVFNAYDVARVESTDCEGGKTDIPGVQPQAFKTKGAGLVEPARAFRKRFIAKKPR